MSLLSPETLSLHVGPDRIRAVRCVGWRNKPVDFFETGAVVSAADHWQGLLRGVDEIQKKSRVKNICVVLSDKFARYSHFPWRSDLMGAQEDMAIARLNFDEIYGNNESANWHFGFSDARPGHSRLSIAIPLALFSLLQSNFGNAECRVKSVQTAFCAAMRVHRARLSKQGWMVNYEGDRLTAGGWTGSDWTWFHSGHAELDSAGALLERIRQELQLSCISLNANQPLSIYLHAPEFGDSKFGVLEGATFIPLHSTSDAKTAPYTFALLGAQT